MRHPNIVQYMGICQNGRDIYLVTEYVEGGDLFDKLRDMKLNLSWKKRVELALETCQAVLILFYYLLFIIIIYYYLLFNIIYYLLFVIILLYYFSSIYYYYYYYYQCYI